MIASQILHSFYGWWTTLWEINYDSQLGNGKCRKNSKNNDYISPLFDTAISTEAQRASVRKGCSYLLWSCSFWPSPETLEEETFSFTSCSSPSTPLSQINLLCFLFFDNKKYHYHPLFFFSVKIRACLWILKYLRVSMSLSSKIETLCWCFIENISKKNLVFVFFLHRWNKVH